MNTQTNQKVFKDIVLHLLTQKIQSKIIKMSGHLGCSYRGANGTSCAVGCLIPDEQYVYTMERCPTAYSLFNEYPLFKQHFEEKYGEITDDTIELLEILQNIHDSSDVFPEMVSRLVNCAVKYQLHMPE